MNINRLFLFFLSIFFITFLAHAEEKEPAKEPVKELVKEPEKEAVKDEPKELTKRFYGGKILRAEVKKDDLSSPIKILNVSEFEPECSITNNIGYALLTVNMDSGRSIGLYDYVLLDGNIEYPSIAFVNSNREYDAEEWAIKNVKSSKKYSLLFKVQLSSEKSQNYKLRFKLLKNKVKDLSLIFINLKDKQFTKSRDIPKEGMVGVDPYKPKPEIFPELKDVLPIKSDTSKDTKDELKTDKTPQKKDETNKAKESKTNKKKSNKKDSWDDWE